MSRTITPLAWASGSPTICGCAITAPFSSSLSQLLRQARDRHAAQHHNGGCADHTELRVVIDARNSGGHVHDRSHAGHHVLAELGFYADSCGGYAVHAFAGVKVQEGGEEGDARSKETAERDCYRGGTRAAIHEGGEGIRPPRPRTGRFERSEQGDGGGCAQSTEGESAAVANRGRNSVVVHGIRALEELFADFERHNDRRRPDGFSFVPIEILQTRA